MAKKTAVLVRDRPAEALRMSLGLTLLDDTVDIYVLGQKLDPGGDHGLHLQTVLEMGMKIYTDCGDNRDMEFLPLEELARRLPQYDHVLAY